MFQFYSSFQRKSTKRPKNTKIKRIFPVKPGSEICNRFTSLMSIRFGQLFTGKNEIYWQVLHMNAGSCLLEILIHMHQEKTSYPIFRFIKYMASNVSGIIFILIFEGTLRSHFCLKSQKIFILFYSILFWKILCIQYLTQEFF